MLSSTRRDEVTCSRRLGWRLTFRASSPNKAIGSGAARRAAAGEFEHVYFVGSGGSFANMHSGKYLLDRLTRTPSDVSTSYDLVWRTRRG